jgi:YegS/Rv2252/BmrU family lipid kinase
MSDLFEAEGKGLDGEGETASLSPAADERPEPRKIPRRVQVIINPAAGQDQPVLKELNAAFMAENIDWEVSITKKAGDGRRLAQEAVQAGVDLVAVNGGDGTVAEAASGMIGSAVPLAILPGGTANVMAVELGIPIALTAACALAINPRAIIRSVDMGQILSSTAPHPPAENYFLLRASLGFEAEMVEGAHRDLKDRLGVLAYAFSALQAIADPPIARYRLTLDGKQVESQGLACIVANSGTMGAQGLLLVPDIDVSDGLLDVVVITRPDLPGLVALAASVVGGSETRPSLQHWQVREVTVEADPPQIIQVDGEILDLKSVTIRVLPRAVKIVVPQTGELPARGQPG